MSGSSCEFKSQIFSYYHVFSKITYYTLISPYRTVVAKNGAGYSHLIIRRNIVQTILCGFFHFLTATLSGLGLFLSFFGRKESIKTNPVLLYDITKAICFCLVALSFIHIVRFKKKGLLHLYESCFKISPVLLPYSPKVGRKIWWLFFLVILLCLVSTGFGVEVGRNLGIDGMLAVTKEQLSLDNVAKLHWAVDYIISGLIILMFLYRNVVINFTGTMVPTIAAMSVSLLAKELGDVLRENQQFSLREAMGLFTSVREFVANLNNVIQFQMLLLLATGLSSFSSSLFVIFDPGNGLIRMLFTLYCVAFIYTLGISAAAADKFQKFSRYLYKHRNEPSYKDNLDTLVAIQDVVSRPVGLKAYQFTITYGLVVTVLSTVMTYAVILLQFKVAVKVD